MAAHFTKWWVYIRIDEDTQLPCIELHEDAFFMHWKLSEVHMDDEGMVHVVATHPDRPAKHPQVAMTVDLLTGQLTSYQFRDETATPQFYALVGGQYLQSFEEGVKCGT